MAIKGRVYDETTSPLNGVLVRAHRRDTGAVLGEATTATTVTGDTQEGLIALRLTFDTDIVDTSQYGHVVTAAAGAAVAPSGGKFGGGLDCTAAGNDARITTARSAALKTIGAFCLEFEVKMSVLAYSSFALGLASTNDNGSKAVRINASDDGSFNCSVFGASGGSPASTYTAGQWYHIAVTRDASNSVRLFVNGASVYSGSGIGQFSGDPIWEFGAHPNAGTGWADPGSGGRCFLDNIRLTVGHERYPAGGFTPPAGSFTPGASLPGSYEIANAYVGECYAVCMAPNGELDPVRNHAIHRVVAV